MSNCCNAKVIDPSGEGIEGVCADCGEHCGVVSNPTNEQELREQLVELDGELWDYQLDKLITFITAHTNAEIAKVLDRLEEEAVENGEWHKSYWYASCPIRASKVKGER